MATLTGRQRPAEMDNAGGVGNSRPMATSSQSPPPGDRDLLALASEHHRQGRLARAEELYNAVLRQQPGNSDVLNLLGVLRAQQGRLSQARELVAAAIAKQPGHPGYRVNMASVLAAAGRHADAVGAYEQALELDPANLSALVNLGGLLVRLDRVIEAEQCFQRALELDPDLAGAHEGLGFALVRQQRKDEALAAFERAVALDPNSPIAQANLGGLHLAQGRHAAAVPCFRKAVALVPGSADLHTNLAVALHAAGALDEALAAYDTALGLDPENARALGAKGLVLQRLGRKSEAAEIFDYDRLLRSTRLGEVPGYPSVKAFNRALADHVRRHPSLIADRPGRTTRHGRQTGDLFAEPTGPIQQLDQAVRAAVAEYFAADEVTGHAFGPRQPERWHINGWATVLNSGGHQAPHNHPSGVVSGVYYAKLPQVIGAGDGSNEGFLEFGRPGEEFGSEPPAKLRLIRPEEGLMVLFPSRFWHRTIAYFSDQSRISIAFDVTPDG